MNPESSIFTLAEQEGKDIMTSRSQPDVASSGQPEAEPSVALMLARRSLEYIGWFDGTYSPDGMLNADTEIKDLALAVFRELGEPEPARVNRLRGKRP